MARNEVKIPIKVDDNGTLKKTTKGVHSMDRRLKGAAKTSSNTSKNFSKMAQGITGGLVPAYATLAASLFAVDAVYRALSEAANLKMLVQGQMAYAQATGIAMNAVAESVQRATQFQVSFKEASQASAIAASAGFGVETIEALAVAANNAAKVLGRSVPDAFDRLIRGVVKAEPEVLDELGIILRLDNATRKYAIALGINANELTTFQKQQAVANDVLDQAERKFARVAETVDPNPWTQLGVAMEKVRDRFAVFIATVLEPIAKFLGNNALAATGAMALFISSIFKGLIPTTAEYKAQMSATLRQERIELVRTGRQYQQYREQRRLARMDATEMGGVATGNLHKLSAGLKGGRGLAGSAGLRSLQRGGDITRGQTDLMLKHAQAGTGIFKNMNAKVQADWVAMLQMRVGAYKASNVAIKAEAAGWVGWMKVQFSALSFSWKKTLVKMRRLFGGFVKWAGKAMYALGFLGIFLMVIDLLKGVWNWLFPVSDRTKDLQERTEELNSTYSKLNKTLAKVNENWGDTTRAWESTGEGITFIANSLKNIPYEKTKEQMELLGGTTLKKAIRKDQLTDDYVKNLIETAKGYERMGLGLGKLHKRMTGNEVIEYINRAEKLNTVMQEGAIAVTQVNEAEEKLAKNRSSRVQNAIKSVFKAEIEAMAEILKGYAIQLQISGELEESEIKRIDEIKKNLQSMLDVEAETLRNKNRLLDVEFRLSKLNGAQNRFRKEALQITRQQIKIDQQIQKVREAEIALEGVKDSDVLKAKAEIAVTTQKIILEQMEQQKIYMEEMVLLNNQLHDSMIQGFEQGMKKGLEDMLLLEGNLGDLLTGLGKAVAKQMAGTAADYMTSGIMNVMGMETTQDKVFRAQIENTKALRALHEQGEDQTELLQGQINAITNNTTALANLAKAMTGVDMSGIQTNLAGGGLNQVKMREYEDVWDWLGDFFQMSRGGTVKGYSSGGKVPGTYSGRDSVPALLAPGEFVFTPKQLRSLTGGSTVVNVDMGGNIASQQSDGSDGKALGLAIAGAVNREIEKQKRIGGSLYTYGGGGI